MRIVLLLLLALGACSDSGQPPVPVERQAPGGLRVLDLDGRALDPFDGLQTARVFVFVRTDCPIANRYAPEIQRLAGKYASRGIDFWLVYPDPDEGGAAIRAHLADYGYALPALRDPELALVRASAVEITPEAALFDAERRLLYRGRIDDRWVDFGKARPAPRERELEAALDAVVSGRRVPIESAPAVGCIIADLS